MSIISFGKIDKSLLYIFLMSFSMIINQFLYGFTYIDCFYKMNIYQLLYNAIINKNKTDFPLHRLCDPFFSYIGVIFLSLFIPNPKEIKGKNNNEAINEESNDKINDIRTSFQSIPLQPLRLIHNEEINYLKKKGAIVIFILILILWIIEENLALIYVDIFQDLDFWFFELIIISFIFSKYFSFEIYLHQKLAMAINIGVCSILKIFNIIISFSGKAKIYSQYPLTFAFIILYFLIITARSYVHTQIKVFMDLKFISHRTLLMCYGLTGAIICLIVGVSISFSACSNNIIMKTYICKVKYDSKIYYDNIYAYAYIETYKNILVRLLIIVLGMASFFFNKFFTTLIIKSYSPIHVTFSFPIQFFIEKIFLLIFTAIFFVKELFKTEEQFKKFLLDAFGDIISILGFLIFLEIIELNFCKLNYNIRKNIISRSEEDYKISLESEYENSTDA